MMDCKSREIHRQSPTKKEGRSHLSCRSFRRRNLKMQSENVLLKWHSCQTPCTSNGTKNKHPEHICLYIYVSVFVPISTKQIRSFAQRFSPSQNKRVSDPFRWWTLPLLNLQFLLVGGFTAPNSSCRQRT